MAAKVFEVNEVLPATTRLRISWVSDITNITPNSWITTKDKYYYTIVIVNSSQNVYIDDIKIYDHDTNSFTSPYTNYDGDHAYLDINTTQWPLNKRTIETVSTGMDIFRWQDLNAIPPGFNITFEENGGTSVSDITEATELPTPLPTPTKSGYTFLGWYYDNVFTQIATAGDTIESNVTLYAKWQLNTYTITFNSNGGTTIPDIEEATELPDPLPIPTKSGSVFVGWYYESTFTTKAQANDVLTADVTLYAKWYDLSIGKLYKGDSDVSNQYEKIYKGSELIYEKGG